MDALNFYKGDALPDVIQPSTMYLIRDVENDVLEIHISDKAGTFIYSALTIDRVNTLVSTAAANAVQEVLGVAQGTLGKTYEFEPSLNLIIPHNLNTKNYTFSIINKSGDRVYAPDEIIDENSFMIKFTEPESGTLLVTYFIQPLPT